MELRVLNYFLMVAREENITRAANLLHITQPTLSRQLMQLEDELGVRLFERSNHNIVLTDDGMMLRRRAQEMVSLAEKTKLEFQRREDTLTGEISIGCGEINSMNLLSDMVRDFRQKYPHVTFQISSDIADSIKEKMENGLLDLGLLVEPVDISKYEFARMPEKERWGILVREDSPLADKDYITPEELVGLPLISPKRNLVQNELWSWFGEYAEQLDVVAYYNLTYNAAMMVKQGVGVLLTIHLHTEYEGLRFIPLTPELQLGSVLAWKKSQVYSPAVNQFTNYVKICLQNMATNKR